MDLIVALAFRLASFPTGHLSVEKHSRLKQSQKDRADWLAEMLIS